jgi:hypothetical protein
MSSALTRAARLVLALIASAALVDCAKSSDTPAVIHAPLGVSSQNATAVCNDCVYTDSCKRIVKVERVRAPESSAGLLTTPLPPPEELCCAPIPMLKQRNARVDQGLAKQCDAEERRGHIHRWALEETTP